MFLYFTYQSFGLLRKHIYDMQIFFTNSYLRTGKYEILIHIDELLIRIYELLIRKYELVKIFACHKWASVVFSNLFFITLFRILFLSAFPIIPLSQN